MICKMSVRYVSSLKSFALSGTPNRAFTQRGLENRQPTGKHTPCCEDLMGLKDAQTSSENAHHIERVHQSTSMKKF